MYIEIGIEVFKKIFNYFFKFISDSLLSVVQKIVKLVL